MRELVYLSRIKLQRFRRTPSKSRLRITSVHGELSIPGVAQVSADAAVLDGLFDEVMAYLMPASRWYLEENLIAGQWVRFSAQLSYTVRDVGGASAAVLFADAAVTGRRRLLLHGSATSLIGEQTPVTPPPRNYDASSSGIVPVLADQVRHGASGGDRPGGEDAATLLRSIDRTLGPHTAAFMHGLARVTRATPPWQPLVASPLFVAFGVQ